MKFHNNVLQGIALIFCLCVLFISLSARASLNGVPEQVETSTNVSKANEQATRDYTSEVRVTELLLLNTTALANAKQAYQHDNVFVDDIAELIKAANKALKSDGYSVTFNTLLPASKNINDYFSVGPYWWPDPKKKDGLPWKRKDGEVNKSVRGQNSDSNQINGLIKDIETLALAYHFTGRSKYTKRAEELLRIFFIDAKTKMNPHLNFAQSIPGRSHGRGIGIIEFRSLLKVLDGMTLMQDKLSDEVKVELDEWLTIFLGWLIESKNGQDESKAKNNHGTYYDLLTTGLSLYLDLPQVADFMIENTKVRIKKQIKEDGSQPHELERTRPFHYSVFNLIAFSNLTTLAQHIDVNLWDYPSAKDRRILKAYRFMADNLRSSNYWPGKQEKVAPYDRLIGTTLMLSKWHPANTELAKVYKQTLAQVKVLASEQTNEQKFKQQVQSCSPLFNAKSLSDVASATSYRPCIY